MAGKPYFGRGIDIFDDVLNSISQLGKDVSNLKNIKQPTMPIYKFTNPNPGDLPDDPVEGQVAVSDDDKLWFYSNGAWHQAGGSDIDWAWGAADIHTNLTTADYYDTETTNPDIFEYNGITKEWSILESGSYILFQHVNISAGSGDFTATDRVFIVDVMSWPNGGDPVTVLLDDPLKIGMVPVSGSGWQFFLTEIELLSLDPTRVPLTLRLECGSTSLSDVIGDLHTGILKISSRALVDPF